ncbi:hypothetical protein HAP41_0000016575 [Bradyrhizobium barranii subsp. apii]|uniref:Uncharacterized protein n=1 Tax=Bradyrhizobium barranii subsp. apii TaxID=2819348 RepID=A0A8T5VQ58_9BRAD|nr:hypothetical protein [Bradyrhizobium barranii]UPT90399.1 hypothetical protein HAP41_0000016575 [Bradyrhizobium barranii subsp. apii]
MDVLVARPGTFDFNRINLLRVAQVALATTALLVFIFIRNDRLVLSPELWAEDFNIYLVEDRLFGYRALLLPYNGFVQLCCRIVAFISGFASLEIIPRLYASFFMISIIWTAALAFVSTAFQGWGKTAAVLALVASPVGSEVFYGMCYMQWVMGPAVALALYERNPTRDHGIALASTFALVGLSSPFTIIAAPLVAFKVFTERTLYSKALAVITALAGLVQISHVVKRASGTAAAGTLSEKTDYFTSIFFRWITGYEDISTRAATSISIAVALAGIWFLWQNKKVAARPTIYFLAFGLTLLAVSCFTAPPLDHVNQYQNYGRYFYIPLVLVIWTIISVLRSANLRHFTLMAALLWLFSVNVTHGIGDHIVDVKWAASTHCLRTQQYCEMEINPTVLGPRSAPTDYQLLTLAKEERQKFKAMLR